MKPGEIIDQIKHLPWKKRGWIYAGGIVVVLGVAVGLYSILTSSASSSSATARETIYTTTARKGDVRISAKGSGVLVASQQVDLSFSTGGKVGELNVKVGDHVSSGGTMARLDNAASLEMEVASAELAYAEAKQALDTLNSGSEVALATAYKDWMDARANYDTLYTAQLRTDYSRCAKEVNMQNAGKVDSAQEKLDRLEHSYGTEEWIAAKSEYDTAYADWQYCLSYTPNEKAQAKAAADVAKVTMDQAEKKYNLLKANSGFDPDELDTTKIAMKQAEIQLANAKNDLAGAVLIAPFDGTVTDITAGVGEIVDTSSFITFADLDHLQVEVQLNETDLEKMARGNKATVVFDAFPNVTYKGSIIQVQPSLESSGRVPVVKGLIALEDLPEDEKQVLPIGLNGTAVVISKEAVDVVRVPLDALRDLGDGEYGVFVMNRDNELRLRTVEVGLMDDTFAEIKSGLKEGETVSTGTVRTNY